MAFLRWSICFGIILLLAFAGVAYADSTYDYTGPVLDKGHGPGDPLGTQLTGSVTFGSAVTSGFTGNIGVYVGSTTSGDVLSWALTDGVYMASSTSNGAGGSPFLDFTFSNGAITAWGIDVTTSFLGSSFVEFLSNSPSMGPYDDIPGLTDASLLNSSLGGCCTYGIWENYNTVAPNSPNPGTWTLQGAPTPTPTPEPGTLTLIGAGIIGVAGALRRRLHW